MVNLIPFRLQGREGLGFLASVNLSLDARATLALGIGGRGLVRQHDIDSPSARSPFPSHHTIGELTGQCGQGLNILDNAGLFAMVADSNTCLT